MDQLTGLRRDRPKGYKRTYYRQNAVTESCPFQGDLMSEILQRLVELKIDDIRHEHVSMD
jgi:hypothetical protein